MKIEQRCQNGSFRAWGEIMAGQQQYPDAEKLVRALRVIRTWAQYDFDAMQRVALIPSDVVDLCDKTLDEWERDGGGDD